MLAEIKTARPRPPAEADGTKDEKAMNYNSVTDPKSQVPAAPEIEKSLLGGCILSSQILSDTVAEVTTEEVFFDRRHQTIFRVLKDFYLEGRQADAALPVDKLRHDPTGKSIGASYIAAMMDVIPSAAMAKEWRSSLVKKQQLRQLKKLADDLIKSISTGTDPALLLEEFQWRLTNGTGDSTAKRLSPLSISAALESPPERRAFVVQEYIPCGTVGLLTGTGGLGKSYLILILAIAVATGRHVPPFRPAKAGKVLLINVEDDHEDIQQRLYWIVKLIDLNTDEQSLLVQNLVIFSGRGIIGPLAQLDQGNNPAPSKHYSWLRQQVRKHDPAMLCLDTKSRLFGLEENSNDHGAQWLSLLERLIAEHPAMAVLTVSHTSKAATNTADAHALRGASALADNSRFILSLTGVSSEEAKSIGLPENEVVKLSHVKSSYAMAQPPAFFRRSKHGVPVLIDRQQMTLERLGGALDLLVATLRQDWPDGIGKRHLERGEGDGRTVRDAILNEIGLPKSLWGEVVNFGIESSRLTVATNPQSSSNNAGKIITATWQNQFSTGEFSTGADWRKNDLAN